MERPVLDWPGPIAVAHRGSRLLWPENTMLAFRSAVELGFSWLETDLHLTADGVVVCLHDDTLDRTTNGSGYVWDHSLTQVASLDAGYHHDRRRGFPFRGQGARIPTLEEVATTFPHVRLILDLKQDGLEEPLADLVGRLELWDRVIVGSFSDSRLSRFRQLTVGGVATSSGPTESRLLWRAALTGGSADTMADCVQVPTVYRGLPVVTRRSVAGFHRLGLPVHVWTVNRPSQMRRLLAWGVDGLISDRPDLLRKVLQERGEWVE